MTALKLRIQNGEPLKLALVEHYYNGRWIKYPKDRVYNLVGFVKVTDYETDETIIFKMPERTVYREQRDSELD